MKPGKLLGPSKISFHQQTSKYIREKKKQKIKKIWENIKKIFCYVRIDVDWEAISRCF